MRTFIIKNKLLWRAAALVFWIGVWAVIAAAVGKELLVPSPLRVAQRLTDLVRHREFWLAAGFTLARVSAGFAAGAVAGILCALLTTRYRAAEYLLSPLLSLIRSTPVASFILLVIVWVGRDTVPVVCAFLMVLPAMWDSMRGAITAIDPQLREVASVYGFGRYKRFLLLWLPSVKPGMFYGFGTSVGLAWKSGIAAEVLCVPRSAIGRYLYESKLYLETADLFAWTVVIVLMSIAMSFIIRRLTHISSEKGGEGNAVDKGSDQELRGTEGA